MREFGKICLLGYIFLSLANNLFAQDDHSLQFFEQADSFHQQRFNLALTGAAVSYTGFSIALYNTWYKQFPRSSFHFFNDCGEWNNMDKAGHIYTAYIQGVLCYKGAKWTGLSDNKSIMVGAICGSLFQSTI